MYPNVWTVSPVTPASPSGTFHGKGDRYNIGLIGSIPCCRPKKEQPSHLFPVLLECYKSSPKNNPVWGAGGFPRLGWTCTGNPRKFAGQILWFPVGFPKKTTPMTDQQPQSAPPYVVQQAPADPWAAATRGVRTPGWKQASEHVEHLRPQSIHYPWWNEKLLGKL